jgi:hypothetical protein
MICCKIYKIKKKIEKKSKTLKDKKMYNDEAYSY